MANGKYLCFIDDDVICEPQWLDAISEGFRKGYAGVSGPAVIPPEYRKQRDIFKYEWIARLFASSKEVGKLTKAGTWTRGASRADCSYEGEVDYLEACNMAFRADAFWEVGGFDEKFEGVGDWSEPDLCCRLRSFGYKLFFKNAARLEHHPSQTGAYTKRLKKCSRLENYELFSRRWVKPCWQHSLHKWTLKQYINFKEKGWL